MINSIVCSLWSPLCLCMRTIAVGLLMSLCVTPTMAAGKLQPAFDFTGKVMDSCDINEVSASTIFLAAAAQSDAHLIVDVHNAAPPALRGVIGLSNLGFNRTWATVSRCAGRGYAHCQSATEGRITINSYAGGVIHGRLRYRIKGGPWNEGSFRAVITMLPKAFYCG